MSKQSTAYECQKQTYICHLTAKLGEGERDEVGLPPGNKAFLWMEDGASWVIT
jgi:hypothetical protein